MELDPFEFETNSIRTHSFEYFLKLSVIVWEKAIKFQIAITLCKFWSKFLAMGQQNIHSPIVNHFLLTVENWNMSKYIQTTIF